MYIDSKQSLNEVVSTFRQALKKITHQELKFNSAHQLFARIFNYKTQAALLNDLPLCLNFNNKLNISVISEYFDDTTLPRHLTFLGYDVEDIIRQLLPAFTLSPKEAIALVGFDTMRLTSNESKDEYNYNENMEIFACSNLNKTFRFYLSNNKLMEAEEYFRLARRIKDHYRDFDLTKALNDTLSLGKICLFKSLAKKSHFIGAEQQIKIFEIACNQENYRTSIIAVNAFEFKAEYLFCALLNTLKDHDIYKARDLFTLLTELNVDLNDIFPSRNMCLSDAIIQNIKHKDKINLLLSLNITSHELTTGLVKLSSYASDAQYLKLKTNLINGSTKQALDNDISHSGDLNLKSIFIKVLKLKDWKPRVDDLFQLCDFQEPALYALCMAPKANNYSEVDDLLDKVQYMVAKGVIVGGTEAVEHCVNHFGRRGRRGQNWSKKINVLTYLGIHNKALLDTLFFYLQECSVETSECDIGSLILNDIQHRQDNGMFLSEFEDKEPRIDTTFLDWAQKSGELQGLTAEEIRKICIQAFYKGDGLTPKYFKNVYDVNIIFSEFSQRNKLSSCDFTTDDKILIPLLFKSSQSTQLRRQGLASSILMYLGADKITPYAKSCQDKALVEDISLGLYRGDGYEIGFG
ncbi:MAG: hypothetical protein ACI936_002865 [Paraglaciecola sp.]|jgi:hypothetical protein